MGFHNSPTLKSFVMRKSKTWDAVENSHWSVNTLNCDGTQKPIIDRDAVLQKRLEANEKKVAGPEKRRGGTGWIFLLFFLSAGTFACNPDPPENRIGGVDFQKPRIYQGTVITRAQSVDAFGAPYVREYQGQVQIEVSKPLEAPNAGQREDNPFHFSVSPYPLSATGEEGHFSLLSAGINLQGSLTGELLIQYWQLSRTGNSISGTLTNPQNSLAASANLINLPHHIPGGAGFTIPMPFAISQGTAFSGTLTDQEIQIQVEGNVIDGVHPFRSAIVAKRVQ